MKLSLLITYHNEGAWLTECLNSVITQLGADDEVIVYDDASHDPASAHLVADYRIRVIGGETNIGPARARNALFGASSRPYIHFHDADDLFEPGWRNAVAEAFAAHACDVVFTDITSIGETGVGHGIMHVKQLIADGDLLKFALRGSVLVPAATYARALFERVGGYREDLWQSEDFDFHVRIALLEPRWTAIAADLVTIRRHANQRSHKTAEVWSGAVQSLASLADRVPAHAREHAAHAATRAGSALFSAGASAEAAEAFALAERFGGARYDRRPMKWMTRLMSPVAAERVAAAYRALLPNSLRAGLQRLAN